MIRPQKGHILCDPKSLRYVFVAKNLLRGSVMKARNVRTRIRKGCMESTADNSRFLVVVTQNVLAAQIDSPLLRNSQPAHNDTLRAGIMCKIAQVIREPIRD